jgi:UDP-N-acetyl-D-mannosaminuronate dehydrogenase
VEQVGSGQEVLIKGLSYKTGVKDLKHSRGVDLVRALEAAGNTVWVEDPLFSSAELSGTGFKADDAVDQESKKQDQAVARIVLERHEALDIK